MKVQTRGVTCTRGLRALETEALSQWEPVPERSDVVELRRRDDEPSGGVHH